MMGLERTITDPGFRQIAAEMVEAIRGLDGRSPAETACIRAVELAWDDGQELAAVGMVFIWAADAVGWLGQAVELLAEQAFQVQGSKEDN